MRGLFVTATCLGATLGCQPDLPPVQARGELIEIASSEKGFEPCGGTLRRMDHHLTAVYADQDLPVPDDIMARYYLFPEEEPYWPCGSAQCCAMPPAEGVRDQKVPYIFCSQLPHYHELAHAVHQAALNQRANRYFAEGFAGRYDNADGDLSVFGPLTDPQLFDDVLTTADQSAGTVAMTNAVIDRHGIPTYRELFETLKLKHGTDKVRSLYGEILGETLEETEASYLGGFACSMQVTHCMDDPVPWDGDLWSHPAALGCEAPEMIGPFVAGDADEAELRVTVEIPAGGDYLLELPPRANVHLIPCDVPCGPERFGSFFLDGETDERTLAAGLYELMSFVDLDDPPEGEIRISPVTP